MVRETRYLWVGNIPEEATEEQITEHFKRYGKIQSVRIHPRKEQAEGPSTCTVAFMDIKSASKAHNSENRLENSLLRTDYGEPTATGSVVTRTHEHEAHSAGPLRPQFPLPRVTPGFPVRAKGTEEPDRGDYHYAGNKEGVTQYENRFPNTANYEEGAPYQARGRPRERTYPQAKTTYNKQFERTPAQQRLGQRHGVYDTHSAQGESNFSGERFDRLRLQTSPGHSSVHSKQGSKQKSSVSVSRSPSGSRSRSSSSSSYSGSSSNSSGSRSRSRSSSSQSSQRVPQQAPSSKIHVRSDRSESNDGGADKTGASSDTQLSGSDKRPLGICIRRLPLRSSDTSLRDGLFHEYKKNGKVTAIQVSGQGEERFAIVSFRKHEDACKALEVSQDKLFFGSKIQVVPHEGLEGEDSEFRPPEAALDEYHPKATRTLFVGNLEKDISTQELRDKFKSRGEIIDIDVKRQGAISAYAFVQYSDISSVVKALRSMDGEHIGSKKIKLGFGKSMPTNCVWLDNLAEACTERYLCRQFSRFGGVSHSVIDTALLRGLVYFDTMEKAQTAVSEMRGRVFFNKKIQVDFASRDCQTKFFEKMERSGQLRQGERPDERGGRVYKQQQGFEFYNDPFRDDSSGSTFTNFEASPASSRGRRSFRARGSAGRGATFRGRGRAGKSNFFPDGSTFTAPSEEIPPERRTSRHFDEDFSQGGSFADDSYERELREYGVSQRARETGSSATRRPGENSPSQFFDAQRRESVEELLEERFKENFSENYRGSESPLSQRDSYDERFDFKSRFFDDKLHSRERPSDRERRKEGSRDHSADNDSSGQYSGSRTPIPQHSDSLSPPPARELQKENILPRARTPPTPTQEEPPIYSARQESVIEFRDSQDPRRKLSKASDILDSVPTKPRLSSEIGLLPKKGLDMGKFESVEARVIARKRSHEEAESSSLVSSLVGKLGRTVPGVIGTPGRPSEQLKSVVETKDKANWILNSKDNSKKDIKQPFKEKEASKPGQVSSSSSSSRGDSEHGEEYELSKLHREKWLLLEKLKQLEDGGSTSDNESMSAAEEDIRRVVAKRPRLDEQLALKKDLSKLKGKEELKIKVEKSRNIYGIDVSQSYRKQMEARRRLEKKDTITVAGPGSLGTLTRPSCIVKKDTLISSQLDGDDGDEMDTTSPPEIPTEFCKKKRKGADGIGAEAGPQTRPYRTKKSDEISSGDEKDSLLKLSSVVKPMEKSIDTIEHSQVNHFEDKEKILENRDPKLFSSETYNDSNISKDKRTLEHQLSISSLSGKHTEVSRDVTDLKLSDNSEPLVIPTIVDPNSAAKLCDPRQQHHKEEIVLLTLPQFARKSLSPTQASSYPTSTQVHVTTTNKLQSPCFSPTSNKSQSPMLSPSVQPENSLPPALMDPKILGKPDTMESAKPVSLEPKKLEKEPVTDQERESTPMPGPQDHESISDDTEDRPPTPTEQSVEERIKAIDQKLSLYDKFKRKKKSADGSTSAPSYFNIRKEPSNMVKNLLSRSSIFDQDRERLAQINSKYEPKDVPVSFVPTPVKPVCRTKAAVKEMPTMLNSMSTVPTLGHTPGAKAVGPPLLSMWDNASTLAPISVTTSLNASQLTSKVSPDPSTSWPSPVTKDKKKDSHIPGPLPLIETSNYNSIQGPIPVKRTESASSSGSSAPSASPVTPMTLAWKESYSALSSTKDPQPHSVYSKKDNDQNPPQLKKETHKESSSMWSSSLKRKASNDHDSSRPKEKLSKSDKPGSSKASAAARVEEAKAALPKLFEVDKKPQPTPKDKDKTDNAKSDDKEPEKKTKVKTEDGGKSEKKQSGSNKSSKSPDKKLGKAGSTEAEDKESHKDGEKKVSHQSSSKKTEQKSSKSSDSSSRDRHKDSKSKHLVKESSAESDATEGKSQEKADKKKEHEKDKEKRKEKEKSKSKERKDHDKDRNKDRDKGPKDDDKKSDKKDKLKDKDEKSRSSDHKDKEKDKSKKSKENDSTKHGESSTKKKEDKDKSKSAKHKSKSEKDKTESKSKGKEHSDKRGKKEERKDDKKQKPPPGLTEADMAIFKEFGCNEFESMYDKVKRRSNKDNKEKELETTRQQLNQLHKRNKFKKGRHTKSEDTDSSAQNSGEESNGSVSTASSKKERVEREPTRKKKQKRAVILSSSDEEDTSSVSHKVFFSEDEDRKPSNKQKTINVLSSKPRSKTDFLKSDVFSPYSEDDDENDISPPEKLKKSSPAKRPKKKSTEAKPKDPVPSDEKPATVPQCKEIEKPPKISEEPKPVEPIPKPCVTDDASAPYKADSEGSKSDSEEKPKKQKRKKEKKSKNGESKELSKDKLKEKKRLGKDKKKKKDKTSSNLNTIAKPVDTVEKIPKTEMDLEYITGSESMSKDAYDKTVGTDTVEPQFENTPIKEETPSFPLFEPKSIKTSSPKKNFSPDYSSLKQNNSAIEANTSCDKKENILESSCLNENSLKEEVDLSSPKKSAECGFSLFPREDTTKEMHKDTKHKKHNDSKHKNNHEFKDLKLNVKKTAEEVFSFIDSDSDDYLPEGRFAPRQKQKIPHLHSSEDDEPQDDHKPIKNKSKKPKTKECDIPKFSEKFALEEQRLFPPILHKVTSEPIIFSEKVEKLEKKSKTKRKKDKKDRKKKELSPPRDLARVDDAPECNSFNHKPALDEECVTEETVLLDEHEGIFTTEIKPEVSGFPLENFQMPLVKAEVDNQKESSPIITEVEDNTAQLSQELPPSVDSTPETGKRGRKKKKGKDRLSFELASPTRMEEPSVDEMPDEEKVPEPEKYSDIFASVLAQTEESEKEDLQDVTAQETTVVVEPEVLPEPEPSISFNEAAEAVNQLLDTETKIYELEQLKAQEALEIHTALEPIPKATKCKKKKARKDSAKSSEHSHESGIDSHDVEDISHSTVQDNADLFLDLNPKPEDPIVPEVDVDKSAKPVEETTEYSTEIQFNPDFEDQKDDESMAMAEDELARAVKVLEDSLAGTEAIVDHPSDIFEDEPVEALPTTPVATQEEIKPVELTPVLATKKEYAKKGKNGRKSRKSKDEVASSDNLLPLIFSDDTVAQAEFPVVTEDNTDDCLKKLDTFDIPEAAPEPTLLLDPPVKSEANDESKLEKTGPAPKSLLRRGKTGLQQREPDIKDDKRYSVFQFDDKDCDSVPDLTKVSPITKTEAVSVESSLFETPSKQVKEDEEISPEQPEPITPQREDKSEPETTCNNRPRRAKRATIYKEMLKGSPGLTTRSQRPTRQSSSPKPSMSPKVATSPKPSSSPKSSATPKPKDFPSAVVKLEKLPEKLPLPGKSPKDTSLDVQHLIAELKARGDKQEQEKQQLASAPNSNALRNVTQQLFPPEEVKDEKQLLDNSQSIPEAVPVPETRTPKKRRGSRKKKSTDSASTTGLEDVTLDEPVVSDEKPPVSLTDLSLNSTELKSESDELQLSSNSLKSEPEEGNLIIDESRPVVKSVPEEDNEDSLVKPELSVPQLTSIADFRSPVVKQTSRESACYTPITPSTPTTPVPTMSNIERVIEAVSKGHFDESHHMSRVNARSQSRDDHPLRAPVGVITSTASGFDMLHHGHPPRQVPASIASPVNHISPTQPMNATGSNKYPGQEQLTLMNPPMERNEKTAESVIHSTASHIPHSEPERRSERPIHEPLHVSVGSNMQRIHMGHPNFHDPQQMSPQGRAMPQISPQGHVFAHHPSVGQQHMPQISPQGQPMPQVSPKPQPHPQSSPQATVTQSSPIAHQMQLPSPQGWPMHQQGIPHNSPQGKPIPQAAPQGHSKSQASPQGNSNMHAPPQGHHMPVTVSASHNYGMPPSPIQSPAQFQQSPAQFQQAQMHAQFQAQMVQQAQIQAHQAQMAQSHSALMHGQRQRLIEQQQHSLRSHQGPPSTSAPNSTSSTISTSSHGGDKPAVAMQQAIKEGTRTQAAFLQPNYMANNTARSASSPVHGQQPPAQASASISHPSAKQLSTSTSAPVLQRPPSAHAVSNAAPQNRPPSAHLSFPSPQVTAPTWVHREEKEQQQRQLSHNQHERLQQDPRLMPPPQSGMLHPHQHQVQVHPGQGPTTQTQHTLGKTHSPSGVLMGIVQNQPQTLPPKEASPTGQVIERVPNPVLRGGTGPGRDARGMQMMNHVAIHERVIGERFPHERPAHERASLEREAEREEQERLNHERAREGRLSQERANHERVQAQAIAMQGLVNQTGHPVHPMAHMQTPPYAHQPANFGLHHGQPSELRTALNTPSRNNTQPHQQHPPRSMASHSPNPMAPPQGHLGLQLPLAHSNTQQPLPAHGGGKTTHTAHPDHIRTSTPNNLTTNSHAVRSEARSMHSREPHPTPSHSREEARSKLQPAHIQTAFGDRRGSLSETEVRMRNSAAFVPPDARLTQAEIQKQLYHGEIRMPGPSHPGIAFAQAQIGLGVHPQVLYPGAVPQGQHGAYLGPGQERMMVPHLHQHYLAQQAAIQMEQQRLAENRPPSQPMRPLSPSHPGVLANQGRLSQSPSDRVHSPRLAMVGRPITDGQGHHREVTELIQKYPLTWQGLLALKNDSCVVQMHFLSGNPSLAKLSLPQPGGSNTLRIAQRMRLEHQQLDGVVKRMQLDDEYCMLLAIPSGQDHVDLQTQTQKLTTGFIQYLQEKQAAGIVNVAGPGSQLPAYVVHIFPPCEFSHSVLRKLGYDLVQRVQELAHMVIIVATV